MMDLCPESLDITLRKGFKKPPTFFKNGVLQLSDFFQQYIRAVGQATFDLYGEKREFRAENGVTIKLDFDVCGISSCMENDETQKVFR